jgi:hypothetical protein
MKKLLLLLLIAFTGFQLPAQTTGTLNVSVTTASTGGNYAPRNVFVVWIEDASGNFVKTLSANAEKRIQYLYKWSASTSAKNSQYNRVDAVTGATLSGHGTRIGTWKGTDYNKNLVADGTYYVCFELTDKHAQGNYSRFAFTKGADNKITPGNTTGFSNISIQWTASGTTAAKIVEISDEISIFPNPVKNIFQIKGDNISEIEILNLAGVVVLKNSNYTRVDMSEQKNGIYLVRIKQGNKTVVKKLVKE